MSTEEYDNCRILPNSNIQRRDVNLFQRAHIDLQAKLNFPYFFLIWLLLWWRIFRIPISEELKNCSLLGSSKKASVHHVANSKNNMAFGAQEFIVVNYSITVIAGILKHTDIHTILCSGMVSKVVVSICSNTNSIIHLKICWPTLFPVYTGKNIPLFVCEARAEMSPRATVIF